MATRRTARWNGELESLSPEFLKDVIERMESYGDRVQLEFPGHAKRPNYQVINSRGFKMAFDSKNLLMQLNENGEVSDNLSDVFSLEQVKQALVAPAAPVRRSSSGGTRSSSGTSRARVASRAEPDPVEVEKYNYFRVHREFLPDGIQQYSADITRLMRTGLSAEDAFNQIVDEHF
ncbi:hypothetical protein E4695_04380 [Alcaligenaceae bacterium 429]|uniref:hypothetical protein n=1 Tax=Paenalcaligenes sp. Me52 TaxID=3392038 RepID=UPI0010931B2D|nr:hypothetical protein E4695_04380 [Alcaligenaceae bacterium 429]